MTKMPKISELAKVYLLLTGRLGVGRGSRADASTPLKLRELNDLEKRLADIGQSVLDLTSPGSDALLNELGESWDQGRMRGLLGRGIKMSLAIEKWQRSAIWVLCREDEGYPKLFKDRMCDSAPPIIYGCGDTDLLDTDCIAVVGSRRADGKISEFARTVGRQSVDADFTVVSGGARGIDQAAMGGVLDAGGFAIAVLANGLSNAAIASENRMPISEDQLLMVSPFDPGAGFTVGNAMGRNKLIFALSNAGLVAETGYEKGGTWAGATEQLKRLKFVPMFVRSTGTPSQGLDELKKLGAREWADPNDPDAVHAIFEEIRLGGFDEPAVDLPSLTEDPQQFAMVMDHGEPFGLDKDQSAKDEVESDPSEALFADVRRHILTALKTPKSGDEVATRLKLKKGQADQWLARLVDEGAVTKHKRPVRYVANE